VTSMSTYLSQTQCRANLNDEGRDPDADEERVTVESLEYVAFAVDLASVNLVEERHHHERVEDDGEVLGRSATPKVLGAAGVGVGSTAVDVKPPVTCHSITHPVYKVK